jgi:hypothetical protein
MASRDLERRLRVIESGYGRDHGWFLEHRVERLAVLSDWKYAEMFWDTYRIEPVSDEPKVLAPLRSDSFWGSCDFVFRNRGFPDEVVDTAFGTPGPSDGEVTIRGLHLAIKEPSRWETLWHFRRLRQARARPTGSTSGWCNPVSVNSRAEAGGSDRPHRQVFPVRLPVLADFHQHRTDQP